jgi:predicted PurR-regulated permease PerM
MFESFFRKYVNFKNVTFIVVAALFLFFIFNCKDIAIMFFAAFVISCSLDPIVTKLEKKMPRNISATLVMVALILILAAIFIPVCIMSAGQINLFLHKL